MFDSDKNKQGPSDPEADEEENDSPEASKVSENPKPKVTRGFSTAIHGKMILFEG